ncbi:MAG: DNA polymerase III subunit delta' [Oscillospiraceae bacterium]|nr:DNA polymerase III subunit delta' [Oscillospiraceae bacterium]
MAQKRILPADTRFVQSITEAAAHGALPHAIILSGQGDLVAAARFTAAAMQCTQMPYPCGVCTACRKVERSIHPDVITVEDTEHKTISMDVLRSVRSDAYIIPNEGKRKIYIFPDCEKLDSKTQNVLLKVLEEGPPHAAFLFCAANSTVLLPTIRSRAVEYRLTAASEQREYSDDAQQLCLLLCQNNGAQLTAFCTKLENSKITREELQMLLSDTRDLLTRALASTYGVGNGKDLPSQLAAQMGKRRIAVTIEMIQRFTQECGYHIGVGHLTGALSAALERTFSSNFL